MLIETKTENGWRITFEAIEGEVIITLYDAGDIMFSDARESVDNFSKAMKLIGAVK